LFNDDVFVIGKIIERLSTTYGDSESEKVDCFWGGLLKDWENPEMRL
jgi:hypothetical protein